MPIPSRLAAALVTSALTAALTAGGASSALAQDGSSAKAVGGKQLAGRGVVVDAGAPALPQVAAAGWLVADLDTGEVLAARDPHGRYAPASTLKALTAVTLIPELPADRVVRASFDDVNVEGSRVGIVEDVDYTVGELFSALLMVSGNDAANVLASTAGGQARTAELMNARAAELGARDTHAVNPHGLDAPGQVSSPYDLALIARAGLDDPDFARYVSTVSSSVNAPGGARIEIRNKNKLLGRYPGALGVKNGFTSTARASFIGAAERGGRRLVVTLMRSDPRVFDEAVELLDWGFAASAVEPVGELVTPEQDREAAEQGAEQERASLSGSGPDTSGSAPAGATTAAGTAPRPSDEGAGLTVTLAGLGLAAAALLAVRVRPATGGASAAARRRPRPAPRASRARTASRPAPGRTPSERPPAQRRPVERRRTPR
jgi:serine-type D-Ala-D-Ala carboxypeptidase (penicillin-binding protein 5/6)